jgi:exodeoxyribonuclease VII small subunit
MKKTELTFEEALARMEEIVRQLENPETPLHESFALYEEGVKLTGRMKKELNDIEKKVKILIKDESGALAPQDFVGADDDEDVS